MIDAETRSYVQRVANELADKEGDDDWRTVDLERFYWTWGVDPDRSVEENADRLLAESVQPHHVGQREASAKATKAPKAPKKSGYQLDQEIAEALAEAKLRPARDADKVDVLRVRFSRALGNAIARHQHALFTATKSTPSGYTFESSDGGTIRALWHKLSNLYWRPPSGAGGQAIGRAAGKKLADLHPILATSWPEALSE